MKIFKKAVSLLLAVTVAMCSAASSFAEASLISGGIETPIIADGGGSTGDNSDNGDNSENSGSIPESGVDLSDTTYTPEDISTYTKWDGKTKLAAGTNYYIDSKVKVKKSFTLPEASRLIVCGGAQLLVYGASKLNIRGNMVVEPKGSLTVSGKINLLQSGGIECYGTFSATKSSVINISSEFVIRHSAKAVFSGGVNIYKTGMFLNYGQTTLTANSVTKVTGEWQTASDGRLYCRGYLGITINGRVTQAGYFSLSGELVNSGVFIFETTVKYLKSKSARFAVSKSSRLIDYRRGTDTTTGDIGGDDDIGGNTDVGAKGIDVSYAQGAIDWAEVKKAGVQFAMIRASRGRANSKKPMAKDITFDYNITEASKNGIKVGVYHYLYADTVEEAKKEARFFLETIAPYKITYPVVLDVEEQYQAELGKTKITNIVKAFLDEVSAAGYYAMLYSNKSWLTNYLDMSKLSDYDVWLAQWNEVPTYKGEFGMWQYSCKGIVSGINGYVDLNISYKNYTTIIKEGGYNKL